MKRFTKMAGVVGCWAMLAGAAFAQTNTDQMIDAAKGAAKDAMRQPNEKMAQEMEAWMKINQPGEQQAMLARGAGDWACVVKHFSPDGTAMENKATCRTESILDGRYVQSNFKGDMMGAPFHGIATCGFNNASGEFESTWVDTMSTGIMMMKGSYDTATRTMTMKGECMDPMTKKNKAMKEVTTWADDDHFTSMYFEPGEGGKETKMMEISYTRVGAKPAAAKPAATGMTTDDAKKKATAEADKQAQDAAAKLKKQIPGQK